MMLIITVSIYLTQRDRQKYKTACRLYSFDPTLRIPILCAIDGLLLT